LLEDIFAAGNDGGYGPLAAEYNRYPTAYSISVGDIIIIGESAFIVAGCGFKAVELLYSETPREQISRRIS